MKHCDQCFHLNGARDLRCEVCGAELEHEHRQVRPKRAHAAAAVKVQKGRKSQKPLKTTVDMVAQPPRQSFSRWSMTLLGIAVLGFVLWHDPSPAGIQPMSMDPASFGPSARVDQASEAAQQLQAHLSELEVAYASGSDTQLNDWRDELEGIKSRFRIWGTVDPMRPNAKVENALNAAALQLLSLEGAMREARESGRWDRVEALKASFHQHLSKVQ